MQSTIWLLARMRQALAVNSGNLPKGMIRQNPASRKKKTKKKESGFIAKEIREPKRMTARGPSRENETTPAGVTLRWQMRIASSIISAFLGSGWTLRIFSLALQAFS